MTRPGRQLVVLAAEEPDLAVILESVVAVAPDLLARAVLDGQVLQFFAPAGAGPYLVLSVDGPVLAAVPGEVARLLDDEAARRAPAPSWWIEIRAADRPADGGRLARALATELVGRTGGIVWPA